MPKCRGQPGARRLVTARRGAELLGLHQYTLTRAIGEGRLKPTAWYETRGGKLRPLISLADLRAYRDQMVERYTACGHDKWRRFGERLAEANL